MARKKRHAGYSPEYAGLAYKFCLLGATNDELGDSLDIAKETVILWIKTHEDFAHAVRQGREVADANVAERLYMRAMGYEHQAQKVFADARTGDHVIVEYTEKFPPDVAACVKWLQNRRRDLWRERQEVTGADGGPVEHVFRWADDEKSS